MLLVAVKEEKGWLTSKWQLTYPVGWQRICKAANSAYDYYDNLEILIDNVKVDLSSKNDLLKLEEGGAMTIRGMSKIIRVPLMITFFNQSDVVNVWVACASEEFKEADYQNFNRSLGQYLDSMELAMYY